MRKFKYEVIIPATDKTKEVVKTFEAGICQPNKEGGLFIYEGGNPVYNEIRAVVPKGALVLVEALKQNIVEEVKTHTTQIPQQNTVAGATHKVEIHKLLKLEDVKLFYILTGKLLTDATPLADLDKFTADKKDLQTLWQHHNYYFLTTAQHNRFLDEGDSNNAKSVFVKADIDTLLQMPRDKFIYVWFGRDSLIAKDDQVVEETIEHLKNKRYETAYVELAPSHGIRYKEVLEDMEAQKKKEETYNEVLNAAKEGRTPAHNIVISKSDIQLVIDTIVQHGMQSSIAEDQERWVYEELADYLFAVINKEQ